MVVGSRGSFGAKFLPACTCAFRFAAASLFGCFKSNFGCLKAWRIAWKTVSHSNCGVEVGKRRGNTRFKAFKVPMCTNVIIIDMCCFLLLQFSYHFWLRLAGFIMKVPAKPNRYQVWEDQKGTKICSSSWIWVKRPTLGVRKSSRVKRWCFH